MNHGDDVGFRQTDYSNLRVKHEKNFTTNTLLIICRWLYLAGQITVHLDD
jgi:hypothetical protein